MDQDNLTPWDLDQLIDSTIRQYANITDDPRQYDRLINLRNLLLKLLKDLEEKEIAMRDYHG